LSETQIGDAEEVGPTESVVGILYSLNYVGTGEFGGDHQLFDFQFDISFVSGCMIDRLLIRGV
jgi:hypothetical protein